MVFGFLLLLIGEIIIFFYAQRQLYWHWQRRVRFRFITYLLVAPSTIMHEMSHLTMAFLVNVPFGRRVQNGRIELFHPRQMPGGGVQLGVVDVAVSDPLRASLISIAPVLLIPTSLGFLTHFLLGSVNLFALDWGSIAPATIAIWVACMFFLSQAAFPSIGDHIGFIGGIALIAAFIGAILLVTHAYGMTGLEHAIQSLAILILPAAVANLILLGALR